MTNQPTSQLTSKQTTKSRSLPVLIGVGLFGVALGFNANVLDPFVFNEKVRLLAPPGLRNTTLGLITIVALLVALLVQPLVGQWSDRWRGRWGRRLPFMLAGSVGVAGALAVIVWAPQLWLLLVGAMLASAFANTTQAAWQALIPDFIPRFQHGTAAGVKTVLELVGIVSGVAVAGYFLGRGNLWGAPLVTVLLFFGSLAITGLLLFKLPAEAQRQTLSVQENPLRLLLSRIKDTPGSFRWWVLNRILFWASAISVRTFLINYLEEVMGLSPPEAQALSSQLLVLLGLGVFVLALPAGAVADRTGRRPILILAGLMAASGTVLFLVYPERGMLFVSGGLIAAGTGIFASASWSLATNLAPAEEGALYLALANGATILGSILGRLGGPLIDGLNQLWGSVAAGYLVDFGLAALLFAASSLAALKIPEPE